MISEIHRGNLTINAPEAFAVPRPLVSDSLVLHRLRHLAKLLDLTKMSNRKDEEVVNYLARQMVTQRLMVVRRLASPAGPASDGRQPGAPRPASAPAPARDRTAEPDPHGVPFCEECARRAAEKAA
jgi:hypothetical protein